MAQSRLERIGTIYTRVASLIKGKALKPEDKPVWFNIYEAFPPKQEPRFDRVAPNIEIKQIFYKEDVVRARFQKEHNRSLIANLQKRDTETDTQKFIAIYYNLEKTGIPQEDLYKKALQAFKEENPYFQKPRETQVDNQQQQQKFPSEKIEKLDIQEILKD